MHVSAVLGPTSFSVFDLELTLLDLELLTPAHQDWQLKIDVLPTSGPGLRSQILIQHDQEFPKSMGVRSNTP